MKKTRGDGLVYQPTYLDQVGKVPDDFRRTAVRNLERAGVSRSAAMMMVGHRSESIYRGIALTDAVVLNESAAKLAAFHQLDKPR